MLKRIIQILNNRLTLLIVIATILGIGIFLCGGVFFLIAIFSGFIFYISRIHKKKIVCIFLIAIILRIIFSFLHVFAGYALGIGSDLTGDSVGYSGGGAYIAELLTNKKTEKPLIADELANLNRFRATYKGFFPSLSDWRVEGYTYYLGVIYALFGYSPVAVKLINSLLLVLLVYIIYRYLLKHFGERSGLYFLVISLFLPSLFFFSISGLKDMIVCFLFVLITFSLVHLVHSAKIPGIILAEGILLNSPFLFLTGLVFLLFKGGKVTFIKTIGCALLIIFSIIGINSMRQLASTLFYYIFQILTLGYLFFYLWKSTLFRTGVAVILLFFIIVFPVKKLIFNAYRNFTHLSISKALVGQYDAATKFQIYPERYNYDTKMKLIGIASFKEPSIPEFIGMALKGFGYAIFSPLVWLSRSRMELLACPEAHFMLISFLWFINGLFLCFRKTRSFLSSLPLIIPLFVFLVLLAFFEGNVGTLFRHKTMMLPFYCAILAIGFGGKKEEDTL